MSTTVSTTMTLTRPRRRTTAAAPASTNDGTAVPAVQRPSADPSADLGYLATVSVHGELLLPAAASNATATAMRRRTQAGTAYRIDLGGGIICWLDGDQQDGSGELNWVATQMCTALSGGMFAGPEDAPFVCGPALFTGASADGPQTDPVALSDEQLRRIVDVHADHIAHRIADIDAAMVDELGHCAGAAAVESHLALT